jgi:hypothetical protein
MKINHAKLWAEGHYIDLWTIPHILAGILLCGYLYWLNVPLLINISITAVIVISWEFFEFHFLGVHEHLTNSLTDIIVALIGFIITHALILKYSIEAFLPYLFSLTVIYIILNGWGFLAYKRKKLEQL